MCNENRSQLSADKFESFVTAGRATFTVVGKVSRYTYRSRVSPDGGVHFVSVLTGSDNESDYTFIGTIVRGKFFPKGWRENAALPPSAVAFRWVWEHRTNLPAIIELWHEGRCGRCGRKLTVPESIALGLGPECAGMV